MENQEKTAITAHPYKLGENYFVRTVIYHYTGRLVAVYEQEFVLTNVAWIADEERLTQTIADGKIKEIEVFPPDREVIIPRGNIIDACIITWPLPTEQFPPLEK